MSERDNLVRRLEEWAKECGEKKDHSLSIPICVDCAYAYVRAMLDRLQQLEDALSTKEQRTQAILAELERAEAVVDRVETELECAFNGAAGLSWDSFCSSVRGRMRKVVREIREEQQ